MGSFHFLAVALYCSLGIIDNGYALLPYQQFTAGALCNPVLVRE